MSPRLSDTLLFGNAAPKYWARDLSVVPLEPKSKRPSKEIKGWDGYVNGPPNLARREDWLRAYGDRGIGLLTGTLILTGQHLGAVDVDRNEFVRVTEEVLGGKLIAKFGRKGVTLFVRYAAKAGLKSTKFNDHAKAGAIDILLAGKMTVLPPSLHPDTGKPYTWVSEHTLLNGELGDLPELTTDKLDVLKLIVGSEHALQLTTGSTTHDAGVAFAAQLVSCGCTDEQIARVFRAILPVDYSGNTLDELPSSIASARAKKFDQPSGKSKKRRPTPVDILTTLLTNIGAELTHDELKKAYLSLPHADSGRLTYELGTRAAADVLSFQFYRATGGALSDTTLASVVSHFAARAKFDGKQEAVHRRVARDGAAVFVDLGTADGAVVKITADDFEVTRESPVKFVRSPGGLALPEPRKANVGASLQRLQSLLGMPDTTFHLLLAFLLGCLRARGPFMCLLVEGQQGSGKSFLSKLVRAVLDPNLAEAARLPDNEREMMVFANSGFLLVFDNSSGMSAKISDLLCSIATGSAYVNRSLYTNEDLHVIVAVRPFIINGISDVATRPDLLERAIPIHLERMNDSERKTEEQMLAALHAMLPDVLGALYSLVSTALANEATVEPPTALRMADTARWLAAAERGTGLPAGTIVNAVAEAQNQRVVERVENEPVVIAVRAVLANGPFEGTMGEFLVEITPDFNKSRFFPESALSLSKAMERLKTALAKAGVHFRREGKSNKGQRIRVWEEGQEDTPAPRHKKQKQASIHGKI